LGYAGEKIQESCSELNNESVDKVSWTTTVSFHKEQSKLSIGYYQFENGYTKGYSF
jgi:hypothetical protein